MDGVLFSLWHAVQQGMPSCCMGLMGKSGCWVIVGMFGGVKECRFGDYSKLVRFDWIGEQYVGIEEHIEMVIAFATRDLDLLQMLVQLAVCFEYFVGDKRDLC